jgi:hypothetical protein
MSVEIPKPRPVLWPLRPEESAAHTVARHDGEVVVTIEHAPLRGVTAEMLRWWYGHVPGTMAYAGGTWPRYLVWHPLDHIAYEVVRPAPTGGVGTGAELHITEALGRDPDNVHDIHPRVVELAAGRAVIAKRVLGTA